MQIIIGLMGPKGSGKDALADYHIKECGANGKISHAKFLKQLCADVWRLPLDNFFEHKERKFVQPIKLHGSKIARIAEIVRDKLPLDLVPLSQFDNRRIGVEKWEGNIFRNPREMLQYVGTELIQSFYKPFHAYVTYLDYKDKDGIWFITDLRFHHEIELATKTFPNFYPIRIIGRNEVEDGKEEHLSESEWKQIKPYAYLENTTNLEDYFNKSKQLFKQIKKEIESKKEE